MGYSGLWLSTESRRPGGSKNPVLIWECPCRAGTVTKYYFGDKIAPEDANWGDSNTKNLVPVGCYKPNPFGLYDMHGNVREWCVDLRGIIPQLQFLIRRGQPKCLVKVIMYNGAQHFTVVT
jgi:formylglycine-generating enzyme required for sulfatase activity